MLLVDCLQRAFQGTKYMFGESSLRQTSLKHFPFENSRTRGDFASPLIAKDGPIHAPRFGPSLDVIFPRRRRASKSMWNPWGSLF